MLTRRQHVLALSLPTTRARALHCPPTTAAQQGTAQHGTAAHLEDGALREQLGQLGYLLPDPPGSGLLWEPASRGVASESNDTTKLCLQFDWLFFVFF